MHDAFVPLTALLRPPRDEPATAHAPVPVSAVAPPAVTFRDASRAGDPELAVLFEELRVARLASIEAFERAAAALLRAFADEVLGRELALQPADVSAIAGRLIEASRADEPVSVRVAPADVAATECGLPVVGDASLGPGDVVLAVRDGVLDARFHLRVQRALRAVPE